MTQIAPTNAHRPNNVSDSPPREGGGGPTASLRGPKNRIMQETMYVTDDDDDDDVERAGCFCVFSQYSGAKLRNYNSDQYMAANAHLPIIAFADRTNNKPVYLKKRHRATLKKGIEPQNYQVY